MSFGSGMESRTMVEKHCKTLVGILLACCVLGCQTKRGRRTGVQDKEVICQSCAMPLEKDEQFGTNADGARVDDYCRYCFQEGKFTQPDITMEDMIDYVATMLGKHSDMPEEEAKALMQNTIPKLKRWQMK